jgi:hypothetical protein
MRDYIVTIRTVSGRSLTITAIARSTVGAMLSVLKAVGEMPTRLSGKLA